MKNIFKFAGISTLLTGLLLLIAAIAMAKPAFGAQVNEVSVAVAETETNSPAFAKLFKNATPAPTPGAAVLFGMGGVLVFTTQKKFARG